MARYIWKPIKNKSWSLFSGMKKTFSADLVQYRWSLPTNPLQHVPAQDDPGFFELVLFLAAAGTVDRLFCLNFWTIVQTWIKEDTFRENHFKSKMAQLRKQWSNVSYWKQQVKNKKCIVQCLACYYFKNKPCYESTWECAWCRYFHLFNQVWNMQLLFQSNRSLYERKIIHNTM